MAKNQSTYTLKIDAELGNLKEILASAKKELQILMDSPNAPKGVEKAFEKISNLIGEISDKAGKELDLKGFADVSKDLGLIDTGFSSIVRTIGDFKDLSEDIQISFLEPEQKQKLEKIIEALKVFTSVAEEAAKKSKALETAKEIDSKNTQKAEKAKKKVDTLESEKNTKTAKLKGAKARLKAAESAPKVDAQEIAKYKAQVTILTAELKELDKNLTSAKEDFNEVDKTCASSSSTVNKLQKDFDDFNKKTIEDLSKKVSELGGSLDGLEGEKPSKQIELLTKRLEELKQQAINAGQQGFDELNQNLKEVAPNVQSAKEEIKEATNEIEKLDQAAAQRDNFEQKIKSFLGLSGAAQVLRGALRDAMSTITELDATMTEMAVVTDLTVGDYWDQLPEYSKQASDLGVSINDAYKAATLYYQQGLKSNEVTKISAETLKMARIAGLSAEDATNKMTAALRGFNMELNETSAQRVSDVYSQLAAITASDVNEISNAMTKTASIAHSAGMEFETTAAFLSQIIETTRESAETAGTALKTVIARFQELKKDPSEIGEVDGEIVDANAIETALRSVGVSLRDANGQFRELDDVFLELSSKWSSLDKNTQRYIATIAAGSRQQSRFIAMMSDYGRTQELVTEANNSAGASAKQFEKTQESLASKIERLKNAWHEFTMGIMESDLVKFGVDVLTKFLEVVNKATSAFDGMGGSIMKIASVLAIFKLGQKIFDKFKQPILNLFSQVTGAAGREGFAAGYSWAKNAADGADKAMSERQGKTAKETPTTTTKKAETTETKQVKKLVATPEEKKVAAEQKTFEKTKSAFLTDKPSLKQKITSVVTKPFAQIKKQNENKKEKKSLVATKETKQKELETLYAERQQALEQSRGSKRVQEIDKLTHQKTGEIGKIDTRIQEIDAQPTFGKQIKAVGAKVVSAVAKPFKSVKKAYGNSKQKKKEITTLATERQAKEKELQALYAERQQALEKSPRSKRVQEIDKLTTQKRTEISSIDTKVQELNNQMPTFGGTVKAVGAKALEKTKELGGAAVEKTKKLFGFDVVDEKKEEARVAAEEFKKQQEKQPALEEKMKTRDALKADHDRYQELRGDDQEKLKKRRQEIKKLEEESKKPDSKVDKKKLAALKAEEEEYGKLVEKEKEYQKVKAECAEESKAYADAEANFNQKTQEYQDANKQAWQNVSDGIGKAGEAASTAGIAISMLGGVLASMGLEEVGEGLATIGNGLTMVGGLLQAIPPLLTLISSHPIIAIIVAALAVILLTITLIANAIKNASAEAKLERAQEAADAAADAADRAAESFNNLSTSLDDLSSKYEAMDDMVRGTKEWNEALQETNAAVLDLISEYPELAGLVENDGGVLKLDVDSDEVQNVLKEYESNSIKAQGAALGAKAEVSRAKQTVNFSELDAIDKLANQRGWSTFGTSVGAGAAIGTGVGAATGATIGGVAGSAVPIVGTAAGAGVGAGVGGLLGAAAGTIVGAITGAIAGPVEAAATKTDEQLQKATESLATSIINGETELEFDKMKEFLEQQGVAANEAELLAREFSKDKEALIQFGEATLATKAQQEAYYSAMAMNAQQLINLSNFKEDEIAQMSNVVDSDKMKAYEDEARSEFEAKSKEDKKKAKEEYAKATYGEDARVDGDKIIYLDEDGKEQERTMTDESWANEIAAAQATEKAAKAMEAVPALIDAATAKGIANVEIAFSNAEKLTREQAEAFKSSFEETDLNELWNANAAKFTEVYGNKYDGGLEKMKADYQEIIDNNKKAWDAIDEKAKKLNFKTDDQGKNVVSGMTAEAANAWVGFAERIMPGGTTDGMDATNTALSALTDGMNADQVNELMSMISSIDPTNITAWTELEWQIEEAGLAAGGTGSALSNFIEQAKLASNAVVKVDFEKFNEQINNTIETLERVKEGSRKYSEEDYKSFVSANKSIADDFVQIGDEFVYLGGSLQTLEEAVKENTIAQLEEANKILSNKAAMANMLNDETKIKSINTDNASLYEKQNWLYETVETYVKEGYDVKDFGIEGLSLDTNFFNLSESDANKMIASLMVEKGNADYYDDQAKKKMRESNIASLTLNDASFNAQKATESEEFGDQYRQALLAQGIQAGVGEVPLEAYRSAMKKYESGEMSSEEFTAAANTLVGFIEAMEVDEQKEEEFDALLPLAEKVTSAIEEQRQAEIDKLSELNDSINNANSMLISKIQEQIDADRQAREQEKMQTELSDMYSQQAYLSMDTSGTNALSILDNEKAIEEAEVAYQDTLVDQALQRLQDANDEAAEQRERQIELMQQQLDYDIESGAIAEQAAEVVRTSIDQMALGVSMEVTSLGKYMAAELDKFGGFQKEATRDEWNTLVQEAIQNKVPTPVSETEVEDAVGNALTNIDLDANTEGNQSFGSTIASLSQSFSAAQGSSKDKATALNSASSTLKSKGIASREQAEKDTDIQSALENYKSAGGAEAEFWKMLEGEYTAVATEGPAQEILPEGAIKATAAGFNDREDAWFDLTLYDDVSGSELAKDIYVETGKTASNQSGLTQLWEATSDGEARESEKYNVVVTGTGNSSALFIRQRGGSWYEVLDQGANLSSNAETRPDGLIRAAQNFRKNKNGAPTAFKTGGLADFTGPAWLDGTKSKPEYVLNSTQTERFFSLIDVLERYDADNQTTQKAGDSYFDININVDKLESDYDVEQMADKIRRMIYDDATYRNVNAINHIR